MVHNADDLLCLRMLYGKAPQVGRCPENIPPNPPDLYTYFYCWCFFCYMIHSSSSCHFLPGFRWFSTAKHSVVNPFLESEAQLFEALTIGVGKVPNSERTQYNPYIRDYVEGKLGDSNFWEIGSENEDDWWFMVIDDDWAWLMINGDDWWD